MAKIINLSLPVYHGAPTMPLDTKCAVIVHHTIDLAKYQIRVNSVSPGWIWHEKSIKRLT